MSRASLGLAIAVALLAAAPVARAQASPPADTAHAAVDTTRAGEPAPADTTVGDYLRSLADSSDVEFGKVAAPVDTVGLDSARVFALMHPEHGRLQRRKLVDVYPVLGFNRVDGPVLGGGVALGAAWRRLGKLDGRLATATGPNLTLGRVTYDKNLTRGLSLWKLELSGGRGTASLDRENLDRPLLALRAFAFGSDRSNYLRRDGVIVRVSREGVTHRLGVRYRDQLELPRTTTATWNASHHSLTLVDNLPAYRGRMREFDYELLWRVPRTPIISQVLHATASRRIGSDFEYRRTLAASGADIGFGRTFTLVPQLEYGVLERDFLPQEAFYLGGAHMLRSVPYGSLGGTRLALARVELVVVRDVLELAHLPHATMFPLQAAVFTGTGAVWGTDPYGGPPRSGRDGSSWRSEVGLSLMYQPGIPDPTLFLRFNAAIQLGPWSHTPKYTVGMTRGLDLLHKFERD